MARPPKQTVDYFPHYSDATNRKTLYILDSRFGNDGYSVLFRLFELLCETPGQYYDFSDPVSLQFLTARVHVAGDRLNEILEALADLGTIDRPLFRNKVIWSQNLVNNLQDVYKRRKCEQPIKPEISSNIVNVNNNSIPVNNNSIPVNEKPVSRHKRNKSKLNKNKVDNITSRRESDTTLSVLRESKSLDKTNNFKETGDVRERVASEGDTKRGATKSPGRRPAADPRVYVIFSRIKEYYQEIHPDLKVDPIPNYAAEGAHIKKMLARGLDPPDIFECWAAKTGQKGEYCPMSFVNLDILGWLNNGKQFIKQNGSKPGGKVSKDQYNPFALKEK